jgi:CRP/FNR family transcriptional regulator, dissimilatory nitrate respiration regulator
MHPELRQALPPGRDRRLAPGEALFRAGDLALGLVVVRDGALELVRISAEGRRQWRRSGGGSRTGLPLRRCRLVRPDGARVAAPSLVTIHPAAELRRAAEADPGLGWRIAAHLAARLGAERARAERLALPHAADRLLDVLHALPPEPDGTRRLGRSWKSLAAELGLSHEATYRALARLERAGLLRREGSDRVRLPAAAA